MNSPPELVTRRKVFYIPGYDPFPARRYRELYRREGALQAALSGYELALLPSARTSQSGTHPRRFGWRAECNVGGARTVVDFDVLVWSDLVQASMGSSILSTYWRMLRTVTLYICTGALWRLMALRKGPVIAAFYPVAMLLLQALLAVFAGLTTYWLTVAGFSAIGLAGLAGLPLLHQLSGLGAGLFVTRRVIRAFKALDGRFFAYYLMHDFSYAAASRGAYAPDLEARISVFAGEVSAALRGAYDEVLVVGHSSGAHLGVSILADVLRSGVAPKNGPVLAFLSLGHVVPMVSFLPDAQRLRRDLQELSCSERVTWIDVSAPGDGCAFALCDPVAVTGVAAKGVEGPTKRWPVVFSAAFTESLAPTTWKRLRYRFFRLHFQYLCAFDRPRDYDYFQITAGPQTLSARYGARPASRSRIDKPVNKYTDIAA